MPLVSFLSAFACFTIGIVTLRLHYVPLGSALCCALSAALSAWYLDTVVAWPGRVLFTVAPVFLTLVITTLSPYFGVMIVAGWLHLLAAESHRRESVVLIQSARAIVIFALIDLALLRHSTIEGTLNYVSHAFTTLLREAHGGGQVLGADLLEHRLLIFTIVIATPLVARSRCSILQPVWQTLIVLLTIPLRVSTSATVGLAVACLSGCVIAGLCNNGCQPQCSQSEVRRGLFRPALTLVVLAYYCSTALSDGAALRSGRAAEYESPGAFGRAGRRSVLFVNDCGTKEGDAGDMTCFSVMGHDTIAEFDAHRSLPRYDKLARRFLPALGYNVCVKPLDLVSPTDYGHFDTVVLISLQRKLPTDHKEALYASVSNGSSNVIIAGDHTDINGVMGPFNDLMEPLGVVLNYDSVFPFGAWATQIGFGGHPINGQLAFAPIGMAGDPFVSVGASLTIDYCVAKSVLIARDGYSDAGTPNAPQRAGLGDRQYGSGETRGGITLAAERPLGRGRILAFGDTAFLQNASLCHNFVYVESVFDYMTNRRLRTCGSLSLWVPLFFGVVTVGVELAAPSLTWAIVCVFAMLLSTVVPTTLKSPLTVVAALNCKVVVVDNSHAELFRMHDKQYGIHGVIDILDSRVDQLTLVSDAFAMLATPQADGVVLLGARGRLSRVEAAQLIDFVKAGGHLLIAGGFYEGGHHNQWLRAFDCEIAPMILGAGQDIETHVVDRDARPLLKEAFGAALGKEWSRLLDCFDQPVVGTRSFGQGHVCLVCDSFALLDGAMSDGVSKINVGGFRFWSLVLGELFRTKESQASRMLRPGKRVEHDAR